MKLHLGCGQVYLDGYTNIDFPISKHTVQQKSVADQFADLTILNYKAGSIEEVRLHHVFEHFIRPVALAMLASWHSWLKSDGTLHIEVPDFDATALRILSPLTNDHDKKVGLRHIFGSNEAPWATHYEGWSKKRLSEAFAAMGFVTISSKKNSYLATHNITVIAKKSESTFTKKEYAQRARTYLSGFMVDDSDFETRLLEIWMKQFDKQLDKGLAKK